MDVRPVRRIVGGAWAGRDAGRLAGDHGRRARFREPGHGFLWAWDEEVAADEVRLPELRGGRFGAVCLNAVAAAVKTVHHRDVQRAVGPERGSWDALDAEVVVAQGVGNWELPVRRDAPRPAPWEQWWPPEVEWRVLPPEEQVRVSLQAQESRPARVSRPEAQELVQAAEQQKAQRQQVSRPLADVPARAGE